MRLRKFVDGHVVDDCLIRTNFRGPVMCAASTMHRALMESKLKTGQWVVFPGGGGGVGAQGVQLAKYVSSLLF